MDAGRWERLQALFDEAAALEGDARDAFIARACGGDYELRDALAAMLAGDRAGHPLLDAPLAELAEQMIGGSAAPLPSESFGAWHAVGLLGEGGMGVVYRARRDDLDAEAAVKILRDAALSPARRERFAFEQRTLAHLDHPSIARLYDAGTLRDGTPWFAMEFVEGRPITEFCERNGAPLDQRLRLFRAVCAAVRHAHSHAIIHRDLKPSNVLVRTDGSVKLLDFGIAKQIEDLDDAQDRTRTAFRMLTPAYAAPEQLRGGQVGTYTDVYALGVMLYELLAGKRPFDDHVAGGERGAPQPPSAMARAMTLLYAGARTPAVSGSMWADLDVLCLTAMHADPARRYASVDALIRDVDRFLAGDPLEARPDSLRYRLGKFARRHRRPLAAAAAVVIAGAALITFYTVRLAAARNAALAEAARTERIQRFMLSLFRGEGDAGPADTLRVTTLIERGRREAAGLDAEPAVQAEFYETLGGIYQILGDHARADTLLEAALDGRRRLLRAPHPDIAKSLIALGHLRTDQAALDEAESLVREGLAMSRASLPAAHPAIGRAQVALGRVLQERGAYDAAIVELEEAARGFEAGGPEADADLAEARYELANTFFYAGDYDASDSLNRLVMAVTERTYGPRHPSIADNLVNLGASEQERARYTEAEAYFRRGLDITRAWYGRDHLKTATNLTMLGRSLLFQNRLEESSAALREALGILERVLGPDAPRVVSALNEVASIALREGRVTEAEGMYRRMLATNERAFGPDHHQVGIAHSNLSTAAVAREDYVEAERRAREALRIFSSAQGASHLNTGIAHLKLGRALLRQKRWRDAAEESSAGYAIVAPQLDPSSAWLSAARADLVAAYEALGDRAAAERYRSEDPASP